MTAGMQSRDRESSAIGLSASAPQMPPRLAPAVLHGRYVRLEPLAPDHLPGLFAAASGPRDTFAYSFVPAEFSGMERYVANALERQARGECLALTVFDLARSVIKGATRFGNFEFWDWPHGNPYRREGNFPDALEIGWTWYAADAQRTGINTETKLLMLTHAFDVWRVRRVRFMTDSRNERSRTAILRLGAQFDGVLRGHMVGADGTLRDSAFYSILDTEWGPMKTRLESLLR